jgi:outer membrane protein, heavy metal efflux system
MRVDLALPLLAAASALAATARGGPPSPTAAAPSAPSAAAPSGGPVLIAPKPARPAADAPVRRAQAGPADVPALPGASLPAPGAPGPIPVPLGATPVPAGGTSIALQAALYGAITGNPDLVALRNSNVASPEAVEVARRFPTTLNPTVWVDLRPITLIPPDTFAGTGSTTNGGHRTGPFYHNGKVFFYISVRQPVELGHQTTHRYCIARAALTQQQWTVVQAELQTLVQTYRFFQTAAYRREKLRLARELADFNDRLLQALRRGLEASQVAPADVALAEVENQATRQQVEVAQQDYANALTDLRNQIGIPETAGTAEPLGEFVLPHDIPDLDEQALIQMALQSRPEIHSARAAVAGAEAAVRLAKGDMIPTPVVGPIYQVDEVQVQYVGLVYITPLPILNTGRALVVQRQADARRAMVTLQQVQQRTVTQVRAAAAKWNAANRLVAQTRGLTGGLKTHVDNLERLFQLNQATLAQLLQARQRLIQLENSGLDALWQATQAQADLLSALGIPNLIAALHQQETADASSAAPPPPAAAPSPAAARPPAAAATAPTTAAARPTAATASR